MQAADRKRLLQEALQHHRADRLDAAAALYGHALRADPRDADASNLLGALWAQRRRFDRAVTLLEQALRVRPDFAEAHMNLGNVWRELGRASEAAGAYRRAIALRPGLVAAHLNLARVLHDQGLHEDARAALLQALSSFPGNSAVLVDLAQLCFDVGASDDAKTSLALAVGNEPGNARLHEASAELHYRLGALPEAVEGYRQAIALVPDTAALWNGLGRALRAGGQFAEACESFREALRLAPQFCDARRNLALTGEGDETAAAHLLVVLRSLDELPANRIAAGFALGHILDRAERYEEAFQAYTTANVLCRSERKGPGFDAAGLAAHVGSLMAGRTPDTAIDADESPALRQLPVFIVGMPRSGTSLVEQILASHRDVHGAGELREIGRLTATVQRCRAQGETPDAPRRQAAAHLRKLQGMAPTASRVIDKMPDNIFHLSTVAALFPQARVIFCTRERRDVALSCFFTLFTEGNAFSTELAWCLERETQTTRLARHWLATLKLRMLEVRYEDVIEDLEGEARRIVEFIGLPWDAACLEFWRTPRFVATASSWQVRQEPFRSSVGRWRNYAAFTGGMLD